ncbi:MULTISPECIES: hypothetical protein [unclassified Pseudovibrio]|uniref:hypothetical protein n=1 Tax=unclassified Pseudovibrio TaxID=2627060 RepID=UPI0012908703|nr:MULTISPECIES: hypothetical protein [unclassified Pseudovibrio]
MFQIEREDKPMNLIKKVVTAAVFAIPLVVAHGESAMATQLNEASVLEYVTFTAKAGTDAEKLAQVAASINNNLTNVSGFVDRYVSLQDDGIWVEVVFWKDLQSAKDGLQTFLADDRNKPFLDMVNADSVKITYSDLKH